MPRGRTPHLPVVFCLAVGFTLPARAAAGGAPDPIPVVGGQPAPPGKWPDVAAVMDGDEAFCTGTLVAPRVVITAGHCIDGPGAPTDVKLGATDSTGPGEVIAIEDAIEFLDWENTYDIGVLILSEPSTIAPRTVATTCVTRESLVNGAPITLVGYGATTEEGDDPNTLLMEGQAAVIDVACNGAGCQPAVSPGGEFIAGGQGVDSCFGDSGGPVYLQSRYDGVVLAGVVSRALDDAVTPCGDGGIYVRPDDLISWIELAAGEPIASATCTAPPVEDPPEDDDPSDPGNEDEDPVDDPVDPGSGDTSPDTIIGGCSTGGTAGGSAALVLLLVALLIPSNRESATAAKRATRPR
jgi:secreted trypsin-like serine protease